MSAEIRSKLSELGFTHAVVIAKDVTIRSVGSIESCFARKIDAIVECDRLNQIYEGAIDVPYSHAVIDLSTGELL